MQKRSTGRRGKGNNLIKARDERIDVCLEIGHALNQKPHPTAHLMLLRLYFNLESMGRAGSLLGQLMVSGTV